MGFSLVFLGFLRKNQKEEELENEKETNYSLFEL